MKLIFLVLISMSFNTVSFAQQPYWQQQVDYQIAVALNDKNHSLKGDITIEYTNNSPDKLDFIWFHLWPNAYKNETTAYAKQVFRDKDGKKRWRDMKDKGYIDSLSFTVNGQKAKLEMDKENIDVAKLVLPSSLAPGQKVTIRTPFFVKIPTYSSRSGHMGESYIICQWYPKPAVYDRKGWHPIPYLDQGEFYSEFGSFDVNITVPSTYVVGSTGTLQSKEESDKYKEIGIANNKEGSFIKYTNGRAGVAKTLQYKGENIHDFAWFADKDFIIRYDTAQLASGTIIDVFTYSYENGNKNWKKSTSYVEDAIRSYSTWIGEYPYPVAQAVEGPKNVMSGGMEYPMITLITSPDADEAYLDGVIAHEVGHNWFYGILGSNERDHAWMDEGINTYYQFRYEAMKYKANSVFGEMLPQEVRAKSLPDFLSTIYMALSEIPMEEAIETPAADFADKERYGLVVYLKAAIWMYLVEMSLGEEKLSKVIKAYYNDWKFRHPYPEDLKAEFEKQLNIRADGIFELLNKKGKFQ
ncbi:MAG: M1 family metallopeptidase [Chitinophagaceae bacterium]|nr:M1 family metallopeptidase [Chitinophagaceae bacterium]